MKYIKLFLFMFLSLFLFSLDVKAEEYAYCYYNYTDSDFTYEGKQATLMLYLAYNSDTIQNPALKGRIIQNEYVDLGNGYDDEFSWKIDTKKGNEIKVGGTVGIQIDTKPMGTVFYSYGINGLPTINKIQMLSDDKLVCPNMYMDLETEKIGSPGYYSYYYNYNVTLTSSTNADTKKIKNDNTYSKIKNDDTIQNEIPVLKTCNYDYEYTGNYGSEFEGTFQFSILEDGTINNIGGTDIAAGWSNMKFEGGKIYECPKYLKFEINGNEQKFRVTSSAGDANAVHKGAIADAGANSIWIEYVSYYSSQRIRITKDNEGFKATYIENKDTQGKNIVISNMNDEYIERLLSDDSSDYPIYINEYKNTDGLYYYKFSDSADSNANVNYISLKHIFLISNNGSSLEETCRGIFGTNFLTFLNNNVFRIIYIGVPILLILLTTFDFAKVVFVDDKEGIGAAGKKFGKRVIAAFLIYLTPTILIFVSNILANNEVEQCAEALKSIAQNNQN